MFLKGNEAGLCLFVCPSTLIQSTDNDVPEKVTPAMAAQLLQRVAVSFVAATPVCNLCLCVVDLTPSIVARSSQPRGTLASEIVRAPSIVNASNELVDAFDNSRLEGFSSPVCRLGRLLSVVIIILYLFLVQFAAFASSVSALLAIDVEPADDGVCARVSVELDQSVALARSTFGAYLQVKVRPFASPFASRF